MPASRSLLGYCSVLGIVLAGSCQSNEALPEVGDGAASGAVQAAVLDASSLFSAGRRPIVTGWETTPDRLRSEQCAQCHSQVHTQWQTGMHAQAWTAPSFQAAYRAEPLTWCRNCHAPLAAQESGTLSRDEGIGCAACHVREGRIVGSRELTATRSVHGVRHVQGFAGATLCAGCHQFNFPAQMNSAAQAAVDDTWVHYSDQPMQDTITEWRASAPEPKACGVCHTEGHRWTGPSDAAWLAKQFGRGSLEALDEGVLSLRIELGPRAHALPTGDPFRALHVEVALDDAWKRIWYRKRLGREFDGRLAPDSTLIKSGESRDTRLPPNREALTATFDRPAGSRLFIRLRYFSHDRWVDKEWTPEAATARVVWSQEFTLSQERL